MQALNELTLAAPDVITEPFAYYARMRDEEPVHYDEGVRAWLVTRYDDIQQAVRMTKELSNSIGWENLRQDFTDEVDAMMTREGFGPHRARDNFKVDPPLHTFRRKLVEDAFTAPRVALMEESISKICRELMDRFIDRGEAEIAEDFTVPLAIYVIADLLNVPRERRDDLKIWSDAALAGYDISVTKERAYQYAYQLMDMHRFIKSEIDLRRVNPGTDMISTLCNARDPESGDYALSIEVLLSITVALLVAGNETTRNSMTFGIRILAENPDLLKTLYESPEQNKLLMRFTEEVLRFEPTSPQLPRHALMDCQIGGQKIKAGDNLFLCWASGNYDEKKFPEADRFLLERANAGQHLTFGAGIYRCVGAPLARMEMKCAFREVVQRMSQLELAIPKADIEVYGAVTFRGPRALPVRFTKRG